MSELDDFTNPAPHHISDVDVWKHADRNYYLFIAMTFLFGFVGLDHMYLRSNETAFKKLLLNIFGLGIWYFWDIIQVMKDGPVVRQHGLNSPFDWIRGIGRGMFVPLPGEGKGAEKEKGKGKPKEFAAPKSYFLYTLLAIFLGAFGADKFYLGQNWQGAAKIFSVFNIFLFLFGILWVIWDAVHAYFMTRTILKDGVAPPIPYSWIFAPVDASVFKVQEVKEEPKESKERKGGLFSLIPSLSLLNFDTLYQKLVVPLLQPTVGTAIKSVNSAISIGTKVAPLATSALTAGPAFVGNLTSQINEQVGTTIANVQKIAENQAAERSQPAPSVPPTQPANEDPQPIQQNGGGTTQGGPGPILAGAFTAIVLAGGLKGFYDFLAKQTA